jgi:hypothetical protein
MPFEQSIECATSRPDEVDAMDFCNLDVHRAKEM